MKYTLLSIKPKYVDDIIKKNKTFEFRKKIPDFLDSNVGSTIIIYSSKPKMEIIGSFEPVQVMSKPFNDLMSAIDASSDRISSLSNYFTNHSLCHAIEIGELTMYKKPISLQQIRAIEIPKYMPGQNYRFIEDTSKIYKYIVESNRHI